MPPNCTLAIRMPPRSNSSSTLPGIARHMSYAPLLRMLDIMRADAKAGCRGGQQWFRRRRNSREVSPEIVCPVLPKYSLTGCDCELKGCLTRKHFLQRARDSHPAGFRCVEIRFRQFGRANDNANIAEGVYTR